MSRQAELFDEGATLPSGLVYVPDFLSAGEEAAALAGIAPPSELRYSITFRTRREAP